MQLFKWKKKCRSCKREFEKDELANFIRIERRQITTWGLRRGLHDREITMPVANLLVCERCFLKLAEEQELRLKGLVKCQYCDNPHKTEERCPTCGAP
ncbi:MAG: hypothetical protein NWE76_06945 [Candidatus Bathyarchaeota archaeon]|nr:hypothetical protein [Candidatus Bathyarchaeota archaeon]